ncbi:MAG TPA: T9SS type A sorting domain-containing protein [Chryseosolibacter sp.]|nr:T9SS type A sorting domain-containing protein [Chryseosolibacter sp.]
MKNLIIIVAFCLCASARLFAQQISQIEYYVDNIDPGFGQATQVSFTPGASVVASFNVDVGALSGGLHFLNVRVRENENWSLTHCVSFYSISAETPYISKLEYFIDTDPGFGAGVDVPITPDSVLNTGFVVNTTAVAPGAHTLYVRAAEPNGTWSLSYAMPFIVVGAGTVNNITAMEYFFNTDPGFGNGTPVSFTPGTSINESFVVSTASLPTGIHTLNLRTRDSGGQWSHTLSTPMINIATGNANVSKLEYFFDTDPGFGAATDVTITPGTNVNTSFFADASSLSPGVHTLNIRTMDEAGAWSLTYARPIIVVSAASPNVTELEYFFDVDPGFGNAAAVAITPGPMIDQNFIVDASGLTNGIHTLNVRSKDASGSWTLTHSMPVIIGTTGTSNVVQAEYFFDTDPGFGLATQVPITPGADVATTFAADVSSLSPGIHTFNMRTRDATGGWSLTQALAFAKINGSAPDLTDIEYYFDTDPGFGNGMAVAFTPGTLVNTAVTADVSALTPGLHTLFIRAKDAAGSWSVLQSHAFLIRKDISNIVAFEYAIDTDPGVGNGTIVNVTATPTLSQPVLIPLNSVLEGPHKIFFRTKTANGAWSLTQTLEVDVCNVDVVAPTVTNITTNSFRIHWDSVATATSYRLDVSADSFASFVAGYEDLQVNDTTVLVSGLMADVNYQFRLRTQGYCLSVNSDTLSVTTYGKTHPLDSAILVQLYNNTGGATWVNAANWMSAPAASWHGITVDGTRVRSIVLPSNGLTGNMPASLADLDSLNTLDVSGNQLTGVPNLSAITDLGTLNVANNRLTFEDLEPNAGVPDFTYSPQALVGAEDTLVYNEGDTIIVSRTVGGTANVYQWQINTGDVAGQTTNTLNKIATLDDNGSWRLRVTNTTITGLELFTAPVTITVLQLGIKGDSLALVSLYNSTGGPAWTTRTNWLTGNVATWHGVTVDGTDVIGLDLSGNNLQGVPNDSLARLFDIKTIDLSNNKLTGLPDLTGLDSLGSLDVSGNRLQFAPLELNMGITNFTYANQQPIGVPDSVFVQVHAPYSMNAVVSGANNSYQWKFEGTSIPDGTLSSFEIAEAGRSDMGEYLCEITNSLVPGLTITTAPLTVFVVADMTGKLYATAGEAATAGTVTLFRITGTGGYDTLLKKDITNTGDYLFEDIVLDEYQILGFADRDVYPRALPTYYTNTLYWEEADTVFLEDNTTGLDIITQLEPTGQPTGQGVISGTVIDNDHPHPHPDGRTNAPKRVKNAAVSARKVESTGRGKEEVLTLAVYGFTDENGEFEFTNLPQAEYRMNVQYPGFPMDETSTIDITVGSALEAEKKIEAEVAEGKIAVRVLVVTSIWSLENYPAEVFPNPAKSLARIRFKGPAANRNIQMTDVTSRSILQQNANAAEVTLDLSNLADGIYLINIEEDGVRKKTLRLEIH